MFFCSLMNFIDYICSIFRDLCQILLDFELFYEWFGWQVVKVAEVFDSFVKKVWFGKLFIAFYVSIVVFNVGRKYFFGVFYVVFVIFFG